LYDGDCGLCNRVVNFVLDRDARDVFRFAALQSDFGRDQLARHKLPAAALDTVVLIEGDRASVRSRAAFRMLSLLGQPWRMLGWLRVLPVALTDAGYDIIARNRIRWFGTADASCRLMTPALRKKFLD
jgi:predicted DCC family thiol-disulfide oxidoreductase YuxK